MENIKNKVFIVVEDWYHNNEGNVVLTVFNTLLKAKEYLQKCIELETTEYAPSSYINNEENDEVFIIEKTDLSWVFYEEGCYDDFHSSITIEEKEVL